MKNIMIIEFKGKFYAEIPGKFILGIYNPDKIELKAGMTLPALIRGIGKDTFAQI
jgi:hypothetical protein